MLAGDARFWMHRIYRVAQQRREHYFDECDDANEPNWKPLPELTKRILADIPEDDREQFLVRRPLRGGHIWEVDDHDDREDVLNEAIEGNDTMDSLAPVIELLRSHKAHEDFSYRNSWIKEDFERSFYSKRSKLKVELIETLDDAPVWAASENEGYGNALFRDVLAFLDIKERKLLVALRMGKTSTEISKEAGLSGHASVSRRITSLKGKIQRLLD
jgi:hypothetical protein